MTPKKNIFSPFHAIIASLLGGGMGLSLIIFNNLIQLKDRKTAFKSIYVGAFVSCCVIAFAILFNEKWALENTIMVHNVICGLIAWPIFNFFSPKQASNNLTNQLLPLMKSIGLGLLGLFIISFIIFAVSQTKPNDEPTKTYNSLLAKFDSLEQIAITLYDIPVTEEPEKVADFITKTGLPAWYMANKYLDSILMLPKMSLKDSLQIARLKAYTNLRIDFYETYHGALLEPEKADFDKLKTLEGALSTYTQE